MRKTWWKENINRKVANIDIPFNIKEVMPTCMAAPRQTWDDYTYMCYLKTICSRKYSDKAYVHKNNIMGQFSIYTGQLRSF